MDRFFDKKNKKITQFIPVWKTGRAIQKEWDYENAVREGFKRSSLVYSCVDKIAKSVSSVEWQVYRPKADGSFEIIQNHPLKQLIDNPNPFMSKRDLMTRWTYSMYMGGNSIVYKVRSGGNKILELWNLPIDAVSPVPSQQNFIGYYEYEKDGVKERIETKDIIHDKFIDPLDAYWGMSPIKSASQIIDSDNEAVAWNKFAMSNRAITDGAFIIDQPLTQEQWQEASAQIADLHTGAENARKFWVLGAGAKWEQMSLSPVEMDFIQSKKLNREDICAIFGVPPAMIGYYENATLANIETGRKIFWLDTILPYLDGIRDCLNSQLARETGENIYIDYDTNSIDALQTNISEKITNAQSLFNMGVPFNDINTLLDIGLDKIEGGDTGFISSSLVPIDMASAKLPQDDPNNPQNGSNGSNLDNQDTSNSKPADNTNDQSQGN